ncbi:flagellar biosynthetic protein FliO [Deltaproteobacteria bacterium OttesenSCG-928-K17]|nr:flagellar biosynthetic protein FliO [Deltaproteobacteria bacterium OttesenSCG-928-K17]
MKKIPAICLALMLLTAPLMLAAQENADISALETQPAPAAVSEPAANQAAPLLVEPTLAFKPGGSVPTNGLNVLWSIGVFGLVMALLLLTLKALGRMGRFKGAKGRGSVFELRGIQPLDSRKYLAAVEVEGRLIVVGVTPDRITPVAHWFAADSADEGLDFSKAETDDAPLNINPAPPLKTAGPTRDGTK